MVKTGMSAEAERQRKQDSIAFLNQLNTEMTRGGDNTKVLCMAIAIFSLYCRKVPFSHFERFLAAAIAHYIASKVEYRKPEIQNYEQYVHEKAPM